MSPKTATTSTRRRRFAPIFAALGDDTRLSLVSKLANGKPSSIAHLTEGTDVTRQAITKHLRVLEKAHIVRSVKSGRENLFVLDPETIRDAGEFVDMMSKRWDAALARLKSLVEN